MEKEESYKTSLNLPKTDFPMRANLAQKEVGQLTQWDGLYHTILDQNAGRPTYILHDGPPYANGHIHIGHALNKILKDIVVKSKTMSGYEAPFVPGWDCHGLPIEHQVLKELGPKRKEISTLEIRKRCRAYAEKFVNVQKDEFKRLGVFGDWEKPYLTMTPGYEAAIVREFGKIVARGGVYKGKKPVLWCPHDETALAEAEVEYADHLSPSIFVKFRVVNDPTGQLSGQLTPSFVIWTTTPWTLVANKAVALHPDYDYQAIRINQKETWIIAKTLTEACLERFGIADATVVSTYKGAQLEGIVCRSPFLEEGSPRSWMSKVILGRHVTLEQGTGAVHTAPGHGQEDYEIGQAYQLPVYAPVNSRGEFTDEIDEAVSDLVGTDIFSANKTIIEHLRRLGTLVYDTTLNHSYPHCWRCKTPVIFRATEQWFISMEETRLRERAIHTIENDVRWIPKWGKERILGMVTSRPDWCISRQRAWGVPIVALTCLDCKEAFTSQEIVNHVADQMERSEGSDRWFLHPVETLLPTGITCPRCKGRRLEKESDILDVWFESGVSHSAVLKRSPGLAWPADLYLEGSDQHRGWFHSSLLTSLETDDRAPYAAVLTHGFTVDGSGKKMSKSAGNVVAPQEVINRYGAEILRLWVAATDFREDVRISEEILTQLVESYRKIRNTCRFLLANLYDADAGPLSEEDLLEIDRWVLHRLSLLNEKVQRAYEAFEFHIIFHALNHFCAADLSAFYLDIIKDRLYASAASSRERRAAQSVLKEILSALVRLMAPILSFTAEEIWQSLPPGLKSAPSVHLTTFPNIKKGDPALEETWAQLIGVREEAARVLEEARKGKKIGHSLEASLTLFAKPPLFSLLKEKEAFLPTLFIVSHVYLLPWTARPEAGPSVTREGLSIDVSEARGRKCERCWWYQESVGESDVHPTLCRRCAEVIIGSK